MILLDYVLKNGGQSVDVDGNNISHDSGYSVSLPIGGLTMPMAGITQADVDLLFSQVAYTVRAANLANTHYVGGWIDDGLFYMGISTTIPVFADAEHVGKLGKQIAIYNFETGESETLKYDI